VVGAVFQILAGALVPVADLVTGVPSLVIPAGYAFAIWGPIFLLGLVYAAYQMLPSRREDPLLRRIGWPLAGAFLLNGVWEVSVLLRQPVLLQVIIAGILVCAAVAFVRLVRSDNGALKGTDLWLVAPTIALLFGWITAANVVSFNDMLAKLGLLGTGPGSALVGGALLILGGLVAAAFVLLGRRGPIQAYAFYAAAVLWGLAGVVANQYDASVITSGAAVVAAVIVGASLRTAARRRYAAQDQTSERRLRRGKSVPAETMKAVGLRRYGPPEVLEILELERPRPASDGVLIRVAAGGVNPADCLLRSGGLRFLARQEMPFVPGADVAGIVEATGPDVTRFRSGDPVYAMLPSTAGGGYAEYAVASEAAVAYVPPGLTLGEAAAVPLAALTALQALREKANLAAGASVLVNGASGGVVGASQGRQAHRVDPGPAQRWRSGPDRGLDLRRRGQARDRSQLPAGRRRGSAPPQ